MLEYRRFEGEEIIFVLTENVTEECNRRIAPDFLKKGYKLMCISEFADNIKDQNVISKNPCMQTIADS